MSDKLHRFKTSEVSPQMENYLPVRRSAFTLATQSMVECTKVGKKTPVKTRFSVRASPINGNIFDPSFFLQIVIMKKIVHIKFAKISNRALYKSQVFFDSFFFLFYSLKKNECQKVLGRGYSLIFKAKRYSFTYLLGFHDFFESTRLQIFVYVIFSKKYSVGIYSLYTFFLKVDGLFTLGVFMQKRLNLRLRTIINSPHPRAET